MANVTPSETPPSFPSAPRRQPSGPIGLRAVWPVGVGALVVICCVLGLVWLAHQQALERNRIQNQESEITKTWREAAQQLVQSLLAEVSILNSNQAAFATSQAQIGTGLAKLSIIDAQLASMVSDQIDATRRMAAAQATLAQETTNLVPSLRQSLQEGLAEAANQSRADTVKLQSEIAELGASFRQSLQQGLAEATNQSHADTVKLQSDVEYLATSLRQTFRKGLAKTASQSRADTVKLQSEVADLAASLRQTLQRGLTETANQSHADTAKLQSDVADLAASFRQSLQQGLAEATNQSRADTLKLQSEVADLSASLRQTMQQGLARTASQSRADTVKLQSEVADLAASLHQSFQQGLAETASQSRADTARLQSRVAEVAASQKALLDRLSGPTNAPNLALALPGVRTKTLGNSILLTFDEGLFFHGASFKADAKSRLLAVAKALAKVSPPLRIEVIGCADDDRVLKRWTARFEESLALDRATAVVDYFIELGLFAPKRLAAVSSSCANRPFPSDTAQNRAKNRTAVLRIWTEGKPM